MAFSRDGQLSGHNSCNQFFGHYIQQGHQLQIATQGATMKACIDALVAQEAKLMQAISLVKHVNISNGKLNLMAANGDTLLVLTKHSG
ncbi:META domain-containing protein [Shewanella algicola]|uniref:META domain-containing protein n=1 Tax=Shewanella algicola TaxID=640633 RepID=A0A9X2CDU6_9GAMM|nr:META domain-containing protein [Shewanella algicola]